MSYHFLSQKRAFTLAEVLITLGIVGVIAALTLPALINNVRAVKLRSQFNKSYSEVQQAFKMMADSESVSPKDYRDSNTTKYFYKRFKKYFKSPIDCGAFSIKFDTNLPCYPARNSASPYRVLYGYDEVNAMFLDDGQIGLMDGALLLFENPNADRLWIFIDVNGYNHQPNRWGMDLFTFEVTDDGLFPIGNANTSFNDIDAYCDRTRRKSYNGITCAEKALKDPNYFKNLYKK